MIPCPARYRPRFCNLANTLTDSLFNASGGDRGRYCQRNRRPLAAFLNIGFRQANHWSIEISGNWRLTFMFEGNDAVLVDYHDYH